jgi:FlaA1/EpsC-like NDP-sugar epimerase
MNDCTSGAIVRRTLPRKSEGRAETTSFVNDLSAESVSGRRVLVTGAGGSIGSELVRQIALNRPARLCLVDNCEYNMYRIAYWLERNTPPDLWSADIGDVRDLAAMRHAFLVEQPEIVFHAAALKHVPLLESHNIVEATLTNVRGTKTVVDLCCATGADLVMISTDKAVNPACNMGLTKRAAEIYVLDRSRRFPESRMSIVRFGNVIGSSGSVVPLFRRQIAAGGPVTVTHPDMTRYLMTIEDAVRLVLASASLPQVDCSVYVLEMGEPVRILDLAIDMINKAGLRPFLDVEIQFVGIRPGEKLREELHYPWEDLRQTSVQGVRAASLPYDTHSCLPTFDELLAAAEARNELQVKRALLKVEREFAETAPAEVQGEPRAVAIQHGPGSTRRLAEQRMRPVEARPEGA